MSIDPTVSDAKRPMSRPDADGPTTEEILDLFGDEYTRRVFEAVAEQPRCGRAVAEAADVSRPTAYRRLNRLADAGLVTTEMAFSERGNHRERFEANVDRIAISLDGGDVSAEVDLAD